MFTTSQLISLFSKTKKRDTPPDMMSMVDIMGYVKPETGVTEDGMNYFCRINLSDLNNPDIPDDLIYKMVDDGWILDKNKKYIENFYQ